MNKKDKNKILILSLSYHPNTGGLETHLDDLVAYLMEKKKQVFVLTYQPIVTNALGKPYEKRGSFEIKRINWFGRGWFLKLVHRPLMEFLYLFFPLFIWGVPLILKRRDFSVIHAQGLIAGAAAVFLGKIFKKRVVISTHAVYHFPKAGLYTSFSRYIFNSADQILTLSHQAKKELLKLGVSESKIDVFIYWINQEVFKPMDKRVAKREMGWEGKFVVLFVGRLIKEKGISELLEAAAISDKNIYWAIAGDGPMDLMVREKMEKNKQIIYLGRFDNTKLPLVYNAADLLIVPSIHDEGFGRVILESLACGTPVIAANRGGIPEAMDETVGNFIDITPPEIKKVVEFLYRNPQDLSKKSSKAVNFAKIKYSESNAELIVKSYAL